MGAVLCLTFFFFFLLIIRFHPFRLGGVLLIIRILMRVIIRLTLRRWYGFVLFLVFVGGLLVVFGYTRALSPFRGEVLKINWKIIRSIIVRRSILILLINKLSVKSFIMRSIIDVFQYIGRVSSGEGVLVTSFVWDVRIVWFVLILFITIVLTAYICKGHRFPLRFFFKK